jgi:hypothetical protein
MSIEKCHLRKLLQLFYLSDDAVTKALKKDIREEKAKKEKNYVGGPDFHTPFWSDAKGHVASLLNLSDKTEERIADNPRRERLYRLLTEGFLQWWAQGTRWNNEKIIFLSESISGKYDIEDLSVAVKVENLMSFQIGDDKRRLVYPYFSEIPTLSEEAARLGLWLMGQTFEKEKIKDIRILDVLRGRRFSIEKFPLLGNEEEIFKKHYKRILDKYQFIKDEKK